MILRKDHSLDLLAESGNVAQFVSFAPASEGAAEQTYCRLWRYEPNHRFPAAADAICALLASSPDGSINLRSFTPDNPRSREFLYGISDANTALGHLNRLIAEGLFVIANETVDVSDGGVSGVVEAGVIEFSPDDTPRCVEKPGTVSLPLEDGVSLLQTVYGFCPELPPCNGFRIEFSVHPKPRGYKRTHTLIWEHEEVSTSNQKPDVSWPNNFSRMVGDKAFGLLVANLLGMNVPRSLVIGRRLRPFEFGKATGSNETWLRTCPVEQTPGRYTTTSAWIDPFELLAKEDPEHAAIASVISQAAVPAQFSGAAITKKDGKLHVEGIAGSGDKFMLGHAKAQPIPETIVHDVLNMNQQLRERLGPVRFEWVHDGKSPWILQLHRGKTSSTSTTIVPGEAAKWTTFKTELGLEALRQLLSSLAANVGLLLEGEVGLTSHLADLARNAARPTRIVARKASPPQPMLFDMTPIRVSEEDEL